MRPFSGSVLDGLAERPRRLLACALLIHGSLSFWALWGESATADEPTHLLAGYLHLTQGDFRYNPEHPPLAKMVAGLPLLALDPRVPGERDGFVFLHQCGNDPDALLRAARAACLVWPFLLLLLVFLATREFFGPRAAVVALGLATFCPLTLAHGHLITTDIPLAALGLATLMAFRRMYGNPDPARAANAGLALGLALGAKFSAVLLIPAVLWSWFLGYLYRPKESGRYGTWDEALRVRTLGRVARSFAIVVAVSWVTLWALYGFRYRPAADAEARFERWEFPSSGQGAVARGVEVARSLRLLPESYLYGFMYANEHATYRRAFAFGNYTTRGWWWYFPAAALVKTPLAALAALALAVWAASRPGNTLWTTGFPVLSGAIFFGLPALGTALNIGLRHVAPVYPFLYCVAGAALDRASTHRRRWLPGAVIAAAAVEVLVSAPFFLAYFNAPARALFKPHEMLVDSNLDWGQDLARLKRWMSRNGVPRVKLSYFGSGSPRHVELEHEILPGAVIYRWYEKEWTSTAELRPGDVVAVSACNYVGALEEEGRDFYLKRFEGREPLAVIGGGSILVFRVEEAARE